MEYQKWLACNSECISVSEAEESGPLAFLCNQSLLNASEDAEIVSLIQLLQQVINWQSSSGQYVTSIRLRFLAKEMSPWVRSQVAEDRRAEEAVPVDELIRAGSAMYAAHFLYPDDPSKVFKVHRLVWKLSVEHLQNTSPAQVGHIYLGMALSEKIQGPGNWR